MYLRIYARSTVDLVLSVTSMNGVVSDSHCASGTIEVNLANITIYRYCRSSVQVGKGNLSHDLSHATVYSCLTLRRLMSYIYAAPILDVSRSHTTTQHSR